MKAANQTLSPVIGFPFQGSKDPSNALYIVQRTGKNDGLIETNPSADYDLTGVAAMHVKVDTAIKLYYTLDIYFIVERHYLHVLRLSLRSKKGSFEVNWVVFMK